MLKIHKKIIITGTAKDDAGQTLNGGSGSSGRSNLLAVPAMIAGALAATVLFSALFALLLVPAVFAWRRLRKSAGNPAEQSNPADQSIDAEYTVIKDPSKK